MKATARCVAAKRTPEENRVYWLSPFVLTSRGPKAVTTGASARSHSRNRAFSDARLSGLLGSDSSNLFP